MLSWQHILCAKLVLCEQKTCLEKMRKSIFLKNEELCVFDSPFQVKKGVIIPTRVVKNHHALL